MNKYILEIDGTKVEIVVIDPTHATLSVIGGKTGTARARHIAELSDDVIVMLQAEGIVNEWGYFLTYTN